MQKILILKGCPASGKSTYCYNLMNKEPNKWKRINNDSLRESIDFNKWSPENEKIIKIARNFLIKEFLIKGYNVLVDNINISDRHFNDICKIVKELNITIQIVEKVFYVDLETAIERDSQREGKARVGENVIKKWWKDSGGSQFKYYIPKSETFYRTPTVKAIQDKSKPIALISDLDGTLAIFDHHRGPYDHDKCNNDLPNEPVLVSIKAFADLGHAIIFCSGREEKYRPQTTEFLTKYLPPNIQYQLLMRKTDDKRKDAIVKEEIFREYIEGKYYISHVYDDRNSVVDLWRKTLGLNCFQVNYGDF